MEIESDSEIEWPELRQCSAGLQLHPLQNMSTYRPIFEVREYLSMADHLKWGFFFESP